MSTPADAKAIFQDAQELAAEERAGFLDVACAGDPALRARVADLLAADAGAGTFLACDATAGGDPHEQAGAVIGRYLLQQQIGEGGFGTVWLAEQQQPVRRQVAMKIVKRGMDTRSVVARFEQERQALAMMDHPNIAKVLDAGETPAGLPYFVMELVLGVPITQFCDGQQLDARARLSLFVQICHAVQHAHQKGVIHRDLKPSNVLVTLHDGTAVPKVIDFGIAKAVHRPLTDKTLITEFWQMVGTPEYMAPEQAELSGLDVDTRADVYSLGVLLYELLTGTLPFDLRTPKPKGLVEMLRALREDEPQKPSTRVSTLGEVSAEAAKHRKTDTRRLRRLLRGDLDWIVMKALEKNRSRRYVGADAFAADVERHLNDEPVLAGPPGRVYRLGKYVRRHRVGVAAGTLVIAALLIGLSAAIWQADRANANGQQLTAMMHDFDQLKGVVLYERAITAERDLYPARPANIEAMERWLQEDCGKLLALQPQIQRTVDDLRARLPVATADLEQVRQRHPRFAEWQTLTEKLAGLRRAQAVREGKAQSDAPTLSAAMLTQSAFELNNLAWDRTAPKAEERQLYGDEPFGLACAEAALAKCRAGDMSRRESEVLDTLAWALFANGRDAEANGRSAEAVAAAPAEDQEEFRARSQTLAKAIAVAADSLAAAEKRYATLTFTVSLQRTSQVFLFQELCDLLDKLDSLRQNEEVAVEQRLSWAKRIAMLSLDHPKARVTWAEARAAIAKADGVVANRLYRDQGIELRDQDVIGLVPIGMNPVTRLWEFYELRSAWDGESDPATIPIPRHDAISGNIEMTRATGIVFVLLPGGTFLMGAQRGAEDQPNYDADARDEEMPHEVGLAPFFLARHELTRAQWQRLAGGNAPFYFKAGYFDGDPVRIGPTHPAESVSWTEANLCMERHGLLLPTEAQWEYGCRAGTTTPWWTGREVTTLQGAANVDWSSSQASTTAAKFDDGFRVLSPVGSSKANDFGLFDVHGNVMEWCRDWLGNYVLPAHPGDGLRRPGSFLGRVARGGSYLWDAAMARSSRRIWGQPTDRYGYLGLRAARATR